jgi:hypothetical protein
MVLRLSPYTHIPEVPTKTSLGAPGARTVFAVDSIALKSFRPSTARFPDMTEMIASASLKWELQVDGSKMSPIAGITAKRARVQWETFHKTGGDI